MKDWGWENKEAGNMLGLFLNFENPSSLDQIAQIQTVFETQFFRSYKYYGGPFKQPFFGGPLKDVKIHCALFQKFNYDVLKAHYEVGECLPYTETVHSVLLTSHFLLFSRAWGESSTAISDKALLKELLNNQLELGEWFIQDLDFGNEWIRSHGTDSFKAYLGFTG